MVKQMLFYENIVSLSQEEHRDWSIEMGKDYFFAQKTNSVPVMAIEFKQLAHYYPIIFTGTNTENGVFPAVILGVRGDENIYVNQDGTWSVPYIPAFVRRYPFIYRSQDEGKTLTLSIDQSFRGFNQQNQGHKLFDERESPTAFLQGAMDFINNFQAQYEPTQAFCQHLQTLELLTPRKADIKLSSGQTMALDGFMSIDRDRFQALDRDRVHELFNNDMLELIYLHLHSMAHFDYVIKHMGL
ncbi:MAG: SapC family protein [Synechococcaceae cyanobacterium RL_1_2]|nr:SapC family protein [Synechococcaceae cyanobacterium RL_1_2]